MPDWRSELETLLSQLHVTLDHSQIMIDLPSSGRHHYVTRRRPAILNQKSWADRTRRRQKN